MIKRRGFTLIELLVVVAIIGMLSSIVLAALGEARENARVARAQSELQSIRAALELYVANNGQYPGGGFGTAGVCANGNETELNDASGIGVYMGGSAPLDPWGDHYWIDGDYQCGADTVGCNGVTDAGAISGVLLSHGPNGVYNYGNGDDVVIVLCKR